MIQNRIIYKVARAYYEDGLTQQEIGNKYGISRIKVSRILSKAIEDKVVQIKIATPDNKHPDLERQIETKYGLKEVVVVDADNTDTDELISSIGRAAAAYLNSNLQGHEIIGLSWGRALMSLVNSLSAEHMPKLQVVQMLGGLGEPESDFHGADLTRRMAQNFQVKPRLIHAPGIVRTKNICEELINDIQVKNTLTVAARADIALVGLGLFGQDSPLQKSQNILSKEDIGILTSLNVVGDISFRFFDDQGNYVSSEIDQRVLGLSVTEIKKIPRIIGVAGGVNKYKVIKSALKGKLIHVLITDNSTAEKLANENI